MTNSEEVEIEYNDEDTEIEQIILKTCEVKGNLILWALLAAHEIRKAGYTRRTPQPPKDSGLGPLTEQDLDDVIMRVFPNHLHKVYSLRNDIIVRFGQPPMPRHVNAEEIKRVIDNLKELEHCPAIHESTVISKEIADWINNG